MNLSFSNFCVSKAIENFFRDCLKTAKIQHSVHVFDILYLFQLLKTLVKIFCYRMENRKEKKKGFHCHGSILNGETPE